MPLLLTFRFLVHYICKNQQLFFEYCSHLFIFDQSVLELQSQIKQMGGGSSKQQEPPAVVEDKKVSTPKAGSKNNSKFPSPRVQYNQSKFKANHYNQGEIEDAQILNQSDHRLGSGQIPSSNPEFFEGWPPLFHKDDDLDLKIFITVIQPAFQMKNLNKKTSQHLAKLTWQYEQNKKGRNAQTFLRFYLNEDGGFSLSFLINQQAACIEGDEAIWQVICPFRTIDNSQKVGAYTCERTYQSNQNQFNENEDEEKLNAQTYQKWQEKPVMSRSSMRALLSRKRLIEDLKNQKGFEYTQSTKYFDASQNWTFSVFIEQKHNSFKSWIVELTSSDMKQQDKIKAMSITLRNDIETRESMYIEEMKKKRDIIKESKAK